MEVAKTLSSSFSSITDAKGNDKIEGGNRQQKVKGKQVNK